MLSTSHVLSECLEQVIISYIAVLSYLKQWNVEWYTLYIECMHWKDPLKKHSLSNTQATAQN